jgi:hypothetical protein
VQYGGAGGALAFLLFWIDGVHHLFARSQRPTAIGHAAENYTEMAGSQTGRVSCRGKLPLKIDRGRAAN